MPNPDDATLIRILTEAKTIAVVGCSKDPAKDAHRVPMYLQAQGYRVIPVNPTSDAILGESCYPSLSAIPVPFDIVDIFRPSRDIPPIAEEAVRGPAATVWMQLGIYNGPAAKAVEAAGKTVVQGRCIMREHARLLGGTIIE